MWSSCSKSLLVQVLDSWWPHCYNSKRQSWPVQEEPPLLVLGAQQQQARQWCSFLQLHFVRIWEIEMNHCESTQIKLPWTFYLRCIVQVVGPNLKIQFCPQAVQWFMYLTHKSFLSQPMQISRAEVRRSFITTTVRDESQVTPQGRHR